MNYPFSVFQVAAYRVRTASTSFVHATIELVANASYRLIQAPQHAVDTPGLVWITLWHLVDELAGILARLDGFHDSLLVLLVQTKKGKYLFLRKASSLECLLHDDCRIEHSHIAVQLATGHANAFAQVIAEIATGFVAAAPIVLMQFLETLVRASDRQFRQLAAIQVIFQEASLDGVFSQLLKVFAKPARDCLPASKHRSGSAALIGQKLQRSGIHGLTPYRLGLALQDRIKQFFQRVTRVTDSRQHRTQHAERTQPHLSRTPKYGQTIRDTARIGFDDLGNLFAADGRPSAQAENDPIAMLEDQIEILLHVMALCEDSHLGRCLVENHFQAFPAEVVASRLRAVGIVERADLHHVVLGQFRQVLQQPFRCLRIDDRDSGRVGRLLDTLELLMSATQAGR